MCRSTSHTFLGLILFGTLHGTPGLAQTPAPARIDGRVRIIGQTPYRAEVALTAYADSQCVAVSAMSQRSSAQERTVQACRRTKVQSVETMMTGEFGLADVTPGWYSITVSWFPTRFPLFCDKPIPEGWEVTRGQDADGFVGIVAVGRAFEVRAGDRLQKYFFWCE